MPSGVRCRQWAVSLPGLPVRRRGLLPAPELLAEHIQKALPQSRLTVLGKGGFNDPSPGQQPDMAQVHMLIEVWK